VRLARRGYDAVQPALAFLATVREQNISIGSSNATSQGSTLELSDVKIRRNKSIGFDQSVYLFNTDH
jgi:hypothetical protein